MARKPNKFAEATIESLSAKGHGLGTYLSGDESKREIEVPFTAPGDVANALLLRKKKGVMQSLLEEIVMPSPDRIEPRCAHFGRCGGCRWQHTDYTRQLQWKEQRIRDTFNGITVENWLPILPSEPWHYRNKMEFSFSQNAAGERYLGLMMQGSRGKVATLTECHIGPKWAPEAIQITLLWWEKSGLAAYFPPRDSGSLRTLTVREGVTSGDRMVILLVSGNPDYALSQDHLNTFMSAMEALEVSVYLRIQQAQKGQPTRFYEMHLAGRELLREDLTIGDRVYQLNISPSAFFQPNTRQAEVLYNRALELVEVPEDGLVYDLYCGTGTLGLFASHKAKKVVGIELSADSALDARENAKANGCDNVTILTGDVGKVLQGLEKPDLVMVDPPRAGLDAPALAHLKALQAERMLYISCNPKTQAENIRELTDYRVVAIQPVDQFPQTPHVENIVVLERAGAS